MAQVNSYATGTGPYPHFRRAMVFVDGENLVLRYEAMLKAGAKAHPSVKHKPDVFAWSPETVKIEGLYEVERASYYTYCSGDAPAMDAAFAELKTLRFTPHPASRLPSNLYPYVFNKRKSSKGKGVDIQMTVDALAHAYRGNYDILYFVSGDGDYKPLLEEVARLGKQIYVAALSNGLNPALPKVADVFVDLDPYYVTR